MRKRRHTVTERLAALLREMQATPADPGHCVIHDVEAALIVAAIHVPDRAAADKIYAAMAEWATTGVEE